MADAPAVETKPDAAPQIAPKADAPGPAPPALASAKPAPAAPEFQDIDLDQSIEWDGEGGGVESSTLRELIASRKKISDFGVDKMDPNDLKSIMGALQGDPDATRQLLQNEIDKLSPKPSDVNPDVAALHDRIASLEASNKRAMSAAERLDEAQLHQVVGNVMKLDKAKELFPHLSKSGEVGAQLFRSYLKPLMKTQGIEVGDLQSRGGQLLIHACRSADAHIRSIAAPFGPAPEAAPGAAPSVPGVPEPGGHVGGDIAAQPPQERVQVTRNEALAHLRAQRAVG